MRYKVGEFKRNRFLKLLIFNEKTYLKDWILLGKKEQGQVEILWYKDQNQVSHCKADMNGPFVVPSLLPPGCS